MPFEVFDKRLTPLAKAPVVTIRKHGVLSLNRSAHALIGTAETVELLYDRDAKVIGTPSTGNRSSKTWREQGGNV